MPQLKKTGTRLLRTVQGQNHATDHDHEEQLPTPSTTNSSRSSGAHDGAMNQQGEEDIFGDPVSSGDEEDPSPPLHSTSQFKQPRNPPINHAPSKPPVFKRPATLRSPSSAGSKRNSDASSDTDDAGVFSSQSSAPKRTKTNGHFSGNIHARSTYGKAAQRRADREQQRPKFKVAGSTTEHVEAVPEAKVFKMPKAVAAVDTGNPKPQFRLSAGTGERTTSDGPPSSPLSSLRSSPGVEEVDPSQRPTSEPYVPYVECPICHQQVDKFLQEEFEDEYAQQGQLSFKWQRRFCIFHKQHDARGTWKARGYPDIDWNGLEKRMRRHRAHLLAVTDGAVESYYREQLAERLKSGTRTAMQGMKEDEKRPALMGYYGPQGEKVLTDYIVKHLSDRLRTRAAKDRLVAAAGVSGGVSGFVQAVLVPELAQRLVMEDMKASESQARGIIVESVELGDLLHPEAEEDVTETIDLDD